MEGALFVDARPGADHDIMYFRLLNLGGRLAFPAFREETARFDFSPGLPPRHLLRSACEGAVRAVLVHDAEVEWLVGEPLDVSGPRLLWTITELPLLGDPHVLDADSPPDHPTG